MSEHSYHGYEAIEIEVTDRGVATVRLPSLERRAASIRAGGRSNEYHMELADGLAELRSDDDVRVVVITGGADGVFLTSGAAVPYLMENGPDRGRANGDAVWEDLIGNIRHTQTIVEMEKPVIARVNGHAWGPGQSIMFGCDLIVAWEGARICDTHMVIDEVAPMVKRNHVPPGDGGAVFVPLYMSPAMAKEYLMLGREMSAAELARLGMINYAVPMDRLDEVVDGLVERLLRRSPESIALTKRIANRRVADHMNLTLDMSAGYEALAILLNARKKASS
jgi:enoyl-CoA hydratase